MKRLLTADAVKDYTDAPPAVQKAFDKQVKLLLENSRHPSLHTKKYDESRNVWQARVNRGWRFYYVNASDTYFILNIIPHPK
jgi:hypothetical protein